ncbi:hypothetical protein BRL54_04810 [Corynebacterium ulcerans]|nr:hypothetical protein BRL54_04810 [Corynebacterium ulcerans]
MAYLALIQVVLPAWANLGLQAHLIHELVDELVVNLPASFTQFTVDPTVAIAVLHLLKDGLDDVLELGMWA